MRDPRPPAWLLRRLGESIRRDAFEPAWNDALADHRERMSRANGITRQWIRMMLRLRGWQLVLQCMLLERRARGGTPRGTGMLEATVPDARLAARALRRRPGFTMLATLTLALGIGANTAIFSVIRSVLLRSLPYADADRLVVIWGDNAIAASDRDPHAPETVLDYMRAVSSVEPKAAVTPQWSFTLLDDRAEPERVHGYYVSGTFFPMLGVSPAAGRLLNESDDRPDAPPVAVIGYGLWQRRFGGDASVLGSELRTAGANATIVGVLPASFRWREEAEVFLPIVQNSFWTTGARRVRLYEIVGKLAPDASLESARAEAVSLSTKLASQYPDQLTGIRARVVPLLDDIVGPVRPALLVLLGAAGLVLIIACANVASLLLVRGDGRRREVAVRAALGGSRMRIARELVAESLLLGIMGGALGLLLALGGVRALMPFVPAGIPRRDEIAVDGTVLLFTLALAVITGLLFGLAPLLEAFRANAASTLREAGRGASPGRSRARSALVVAEVAVAVMIAAGASLLLRSFANLQRVDPGFRTERVVSMDLSNLPSDALERITLMETLWQRLEATPGVLAAGEVTRVPLLEGNNITSRLDIEHRPMPQEEQPEIDFRRASRGYFDAMSIPLVDGRMFETSDHATAPAVALINEVAAARFFPGEDPLGKRVSFGGGQYLTVVGIVGGVRHIGLAESPRPEGYVHTLQGPTSNPQVLVRTSVDPVAAMPAIRSAIREVAPSVVISRVTTMQEVRSRSLAGPRFNTTLFGVFAGLALLLAAIGTYGVMAYTVAQRRREIGVRLSVGARPRDVATMIVRDGMRLALVGLAIGVAGALAAARFLRGLLYGVQPTDAVAVGAAAALLAGAVLLACALSARRATSVDPIEALRVD